MAYQGLVAIGHGLDPDTMKYQTGAAHKELKEHVICARAAYWTQKALERSGIFDVYYEQDGGNGHALNPNHKGSVRKAVELKVKWAVELHMNAANTQATGTETVVYAKSTPAATLGKDILDAIVDRLGWKNRGVKVATKHNFLASLHRKKIPAVIVEAAFVDGDYAKIRKLGVDPFAWRYGEGVAEGICNWLGEPFIPHKPTATPNG